MIEVIFVLGIFAVGFLLGQMKGSIDEEERQRRLRKKLYSVKGGDDAN